MNSMRWIVRILMIPDQMRTENCYPAVRCSFSFVDKRNQNLLRIVILPSGIISLWSMRGMRTS